MSEINDQHTWIHGEEKRVRIGGEPRYKRVDTCSVCGCSKRMLKNPLRPFATFLVSGFSKGGKSYAANKMPGCKNDNGAVPARKYSDKQHHDWQEFRHLPVTWGIEANGYEPARMVTGYEKIFTCACGCSMLARHDDRNYRILTKYKRADIDEDRWQPNQIPCTLQPVEKPKKTPKTTTVNPEKLGPLKAFIRINHKMLTSADIAEEMGVTDKQVYSIAKSMKCMPITRAEQVEQYLKEYGAKKTLEQICKVLDIGKDYADNLCRKYKVVPLQAAPKTKGRVPVKVGPIKPRWISPMEVFRKASFKWMD